MVEIEYKQGDSVPLQATLPVDLTNASVQFKLSDEKGGTAIIDSGATIKDASNGVVAYQWQSGETDRTGAYYIEWEVTYGDGGVETFPRDGFDVIHFYPETQ